MQEIVYNLFKGFRNDKGRKFITPDYFSDVNNFNIDSIIGLDKILLPEIKYNGSDTNNINGIYQFNYLDSSNVLQTENLFIKGISLYKDFSSPSLIYSGLSDNIATFTVLNDKLFICNGNDYPKIYNGKALYEMGSPYAEDTLTAGNPNGSYYYAMTFITTGGEEYLGTKSNLITVSNSQIELNLPIGYTGVTSRKIYRTVNGGATFFLLTTIGDNTTLTYTDNTLDSGLSTQIIDINNECPKPYFITTSFNKLVGVKDDSKPTQVFVTDTSVEVFDSSASNDVSNINGDNTSLMGMSSDYDKVLIGSQKDIYYLDVSGTTNSIVKTRANCGVKDGYSMCIIPNNEDFDGGIFFVSNLNDVRLFNGNFSQPVATSLDNLKTNNWSQQIQNTITEDIKNSSNLRSFFYNYKYHLFINNNCYVFDIRNQGWFKYNMQTDSYIINPNCFNLINNKMYSGQKNNSIIEEWYINNTYRGEEILSSFLTPQILYSDELKYFKSIFIYYLQNNTNKYKIYIITDGDYSNQIVINADYQGNCFDENNFFSEDFDTSLDFEDYREILINRFARFIEFKIEIESGYFYYRGFKLTYDTVDNKEKKYG